MFPTRSLFLAAFFVTIFLAGPVLSEEWTRFRGPNGSGVSSSIGLPVEMGAETNKAWETAVPFGRSSPAVAAERIFLTAAEEHGLVTLAVARDSGKLLWQRTIDRSSEADLYKDTDSATPSPVTDGVNVYAFFHEAGLVAYDGTGQELWRKPLGPFRNYYGIASSPVLAGDSLLMLCDQAEGSFLMALDKETGATRWQRNRPARLEAYTTPVVYPSSEDPRMVLVYGSRWLDAYDLASGTSVWTVGGLGTGPVSSPVVVGNVVFVSAQDHADDGWPPFGPLLTEHDADKDGQLSKPEAEGSWLFNHFGWLDTDADGAISAADWAGLEKEVVNDQWGVHAIGVPSADGEPQKLWSYQQNIPYLPSPVIHDGVFYMVKDDVVTSLDANSGELLKRGRLGADKSKVYASPVAADGKIYVATLNGKIVVLTAAKEWSVDHINDLGDEIWATPAIVDGHIYVRTRTKLYDFAKAHEAQTAPE